MCTALVSSSCNIPQGPWQVGSGSPICPLYLFPSGAGLASSKRAWWRESPCGLNHELLIFGLWQVAVVLMHFAMHNGLLHVHIACKLVACWHHCCMCYVRHVGILCVHVGMLCWDIPLGPIAPKGFVASHFAMPSHENWNYCWQFVRSHLLWNCKAS